MAEMTLEKATFEQVAEQAKTLTTDEQQQLHDLLGKPLATDTRAKQRQFAEHLLALGIISHIPRHDPDYEMRRHPPIVVEGEPVSETIIQERR